MGVHIGEGIERSKRFFPCMFKSVVSIALPSLWRWDVGLQKRMWDSKTKFVVLILSFLIFPSILPNHQGLILNWIVLSWSPLDIFLYFYEE